MRCLLCSFNFISKVIYEFIVRENRIFFNAIIRSFSETDDEIEGVKNTHAIPVICIHIFVSPFFYKIIIIHIYIIVEIQLLLLLFFLGKETQQIYLRFIFSNIE